MEKKKVNYIHYVIVFAFCFLFQFVPSFGGITTLGMGILGCFIGAVWGWITIGMLWPSLMGLLGLGFTSLGIDKVIQTCFTSTPFLGLILCMGTVGVAMKTGAFEWLVGKLLSNKFMHGKPWFTIWMVMIIASPFGMFNSIIMMVIFGAFITGILKACNVARNDKLAIFWYLGCAFSLMMGQIMLPFMGTGMTFYYSFKTMFPTMTMNMVPYIAFMISIAIIMVTVYVLLMKFVFRVDAAPIAEYHNDSAASGGTRDQIVSLALFVLFIVLVVLSSITGLAGIIGAFVHQLGMVGCCLFCSVLVTVIPSENGGPLADLEDLFHMCNWGQVFMIGFIMVLSTYMGGSDTGITTAMAMLFVPFMGLSPWVFIVIALLISVVLTNVANNMLIGVMVMPFLVNFAAQAGLEPTMLVVLLWVMVQFALVTPAASPVTAVAMTQEMADASQMTKTALYVTPVLLLCGMVIGIPWAQLVFAILG